nr:unnamed protein product [Digitaria exilis]
MTTTTSRDDGPTTSPPPLSHAVDWAGVPSDILACVCKLLSAVPGRVCFRAVCHTWRAVADDLTHDQRAAVPRMPPPWVVIPLESGCCEQFTLASVPTMQSFRWTPLGAAGMRCVGSSGGWIAGAYIGGDRKIRLSLLNPLTDARVDVPATLGRVWYTPKSKDSTREEIVLCSAIQKVAFSPSPTEKNFAVAVLTYPRKGNGDVIVFTRSGCSGWCALADPGPFERGGDYIRAQLDVAYHRGKFFYMSMSNTVWVVDMAVRYPKPEPLATFQPAIPRGLLYGRHHLAIAGDGALHVVSSSIRHLSSSGVDMLVQRYDTTSRAEQGSPWVQATCLGGEEAFLVRAHVEMAQLQA